MTLRETTESLVRFVSEHPELSELPLTVDAPDGPEPLGHLISLIELSAPRLSQATGYTDNPPYRELQWNKFHDWCDEKLITMFYISPSVEWIEKDLIDKA